MKLRFSVFFAKFADVHVHLTLVLFELLLDLQCINTEDFKLLSIGF